MSMLFGIIVNEKLKAKSKFFLIQKATQSVYDANFMTDMYKNL